MENFNDKRICSFDEMKRDLFNKKIDSEIFLMESFMNVIHKLNTIVIKTKMELQEQYEKELSNLNNENNNVYEKSNWIFQGLENKIEWDKFQNLFLLPSINN